MRIIKRTLSIVGTAALAHLTFGQSYTPVELTGGYNASAMSNQVVGGSIGSLSTARATIWDLGENPLDVHPAFLAGPSGPGSSTINGMSGDVYAGTGWGDVTENRSRALLWRGGQTLFLDSPFARYFSSATSTDSIQVGGNLVPLSATGVAGSSHPVVWNAVTGAMSDLYSGNPGYVLGVGGGQQVGYEEKGNYTARLWRGTAASMVSLQPKAYDGSRALATDGVRQVGFVIYPVKVPVENEKRIKLVYFNAAGVWSGSASSFSLLDNGAYGFSSANAIRGNVIAGQGYMIDQYAKVLAIHAIAWVGPNKTRIELHNTLPANYVYSQANGVDEAGNICGYAVDSAGVPHGIVWVRQ